MGLIGRNGIFKSDRELRLELEKLQIQLGIAAMERDAYLQQRDAALGERNAYLQQRDVALGERDAYLRQRDAAIGERDAYLRQRDAALGERNVYLQQRDLALGERNMQTERVGRHVHRADIAARRGLFGPVAATRDRILLFLHLAKTGGVTLIDIIVRNLSIGEFLVIEMPPKGQSALWTWPAAEVERAIAGLSRDEVDRIRALLGHYRFGVQGHLPKPAECVTLLRDPVDRVVSYFCYDVARGAMQDFNGAVPSLEDYVNRKRHYDLALDNYMTRILSGNTDLDPVDGGSTTENCRRPTSDDFEMASKNLDACLVAGLTEKFDETLVILASDLRWSLSDVVYTRRNVTSSRPAIADISHSVRDKIMEWNQLDAMLVQHARTHLARSIAAYSGDFDKDLALFRRLNASYAQGASLAELQRSEYESLS